MQRKFFWLLFLVFLTGITGCGGSGGGGNEQKNPFTRSYSFGEGLNLIRPARRGVAVAPNGDVFLCFQDDSRSNSLVKFTNFGKPVGGVPQQPIVLDTREHQISGVSFAADIAVSPRDGTVYVLGFHSAGNKGMIVVLSPDGKFLFRFEPPHTERRFFPGYGDIAMDRAGHVYSVPGSLPRTENDPPVSVFDASSGNYLGSMENPGEKGLFAFRTVAVDRDDNLYVRGLDRISVFSPNRQLLREIPIGLNADNASQAGDLVVDSKGNLYVANFSNTSKFSLLQKYSPSGKLLAESDRISGQLKLAIDAADNLYVAADDNRISVFPQN